MSAAPPAGADQVVPAAPAASRWQKQQEKAALKSQKHHFLATTVKNRMVFEHWRQVEELRAWRTKAVAAMARLAAPPAAVGGAGDEAQDDIDISVEDICVPTSFQVVEKMVGERMREEGIAQGTLEGDLPVQIRRKRRRKAVASDEDEDDPLPLSDGVRGGAVESGGSSSSTARAAPQSQIVPQEPSLEDSGGGGAKRAPLKTIQEVEQEVRAKMPTATAACHDRWEKMPFLLAHRGKSFCQYTDCSVSDPHRWWTARLAPKRRGAVAAQRRRMASRGEVVVTVVVCSTAGHKEQEFDILASQPLHELRDAFYFASDWMYDGPTRLKSGLFFIDGIFYSDRRDPAALDYSKEIIDWLRSTREPGYLRADASKSMATRLSDLDRIPFGERCVYVHQGDIEHSIYFTNARLLRSASDCPYPEAYPILTFMRRYTKRKCYACLMNHAMWIVIDSSRCPHNPSYWCQTCFRHFFQDADGNYIPPVDYKVFPYLHDET